MRPDNHVVAELVSSRFDGDEIERKLLHVLTEAGWDRDRARGLVYKALRETGIRLLNVCKAVAERPSEQGVFREGAEVQNADIVAGRVYAAFASFMTHHEGELWRQISERAMRARKAALHAYSAAGPSGPVSFKEAEAARENGMVVAATLGTTGGMSDFKLRTLFPSGVFVGTMYAPDWSSYGRVIVCGSWRTRVVSGGEWQDSVAPQVMATGVGWAVLQSYERRSLFIDRTEGENDPTAAALLEGRFDISHGPPNPVYARVLLGRGNMLYPAIPLGTFHLKHLARSELGYDVHQEIIGDLVRNHRYQYADASEGKRAATGRTIGRLRDGRVKWLKPDPFAKEST